MYYHRHCLHYVEEKVIGSGVDSVGLSSDLVSFSQTFCGTLFVEAQFPYLCNQG